MKNKSKQLIMMVLGLITMLSACANITNQPDLSPIQTRQKVIYTGKYDIRYFDSLDELYKEADLVIRGKVLNSRVEWMSHKMKPTSNDPKDLTTIFTVEIGSLYKGNANIKTIEVMQLGGETDTVIYQYEDQAEIIKNMEYVMFLAKNLAMDNAYWLTAGGLQSLYRVEGNKLIKLPANKLTLTFENLSKLTQIK